MKNTENENQESEELENKRGLELGGSGGLSIFNDNYPLFLAYDLTRNLPEEPLPEEKEEKEKHLTIDDPESQNLTCSIR